MAVAAIPLTPYRFPRPRAATVRLEPVGNCIYCGSVETDESLTKEHIVPDGLGGDLVLPDSSCPACAKITSRVERHLLKEVLQFARNVADVRSRKRKSERGTAKVEFEDRSEVLEVPFNDNTPFIWPFIVSERLPSVLTDDPQRIESEFRIGLFGPRDWNAQGQKWLGGNGSFKWGHRFRAGVVGQALAKIAHAYATAVLGKDGFSPLLNDYILATEPPFDSRHIGVYSSDGSDDSLHYIDLQVAYAPSVTALGVMLAPFYVVYLRLFAYQPSPSILIVVGRPNGKIPSSLRTMDLGSVR